MGSGLGWSIAHCGLFLCHLSWAHTSPGLGPMDDISFGSILCWLEPHTTSGRPV